MQALCEVGRWIPEDGSVVRFDDIQSAAFQNPGLTTAKQPPREMGILAAKTFLQRLAAPARAPYLKEIVVEPGQSPRGSTASVKRQE